MSKVYTLIGVELSTEQLNQKQRIRYCLKNQKQKNNGALLDDCFMETLSNTEGFNYCPHCGGPAYNDVLPSGVQSFIDLKSIEFTKNQLKAYRDALGDNEALGGMGLISPFDDIGLHYAAIYFKSASMRPAFISPSINLKKLESLTREILEPLGLWNLEAFGIWTVSFQNNS